MLDSGASPKPTGQTPIPFQESITSDSGDKPLLTISSLPSVARLTTPVQEATSTLTTFQDIVPRPSLSPQYFDHRVYIEYQRPPMLWCCCSFRLSRWIWNPVDTPFPAPLAGWYLYAQGKLSSKYLRLLVEALVQQKPSTAGWRFGSGVPCTKYGFSPRRERRRNHSCRSQAEPRWHSRKTFPRLAGESRWELTEPMAVRLADQ